MTGTAVTARISAWTGPQQKTPSKMAAATLRRFIL